MAVTNALAITIANVGEIYERMQKKTDFFIGKRYIYLLLSINVSFFKTKIRGKNRLWSFVEKFLQSFRLFVNQ